MNHTMGGRTFDVTASTEHRSQSSLKRSRKVWKVASIFSIFVLSLLFLQCVQAQSGSPRRLYAIPPYMTSWGEAPFFYGDTPMNAIRASDEFYAQKYGIYPWPVSCKRMVFYMASNLQGQVDNGQFTFAYIGYGYTDNAYPCEFDGTYWGYILNTAWYSPGDNLGNEHCNSNTDCGNPINTAIGNKFQTESDMQSGSLSFTRYYNSHSASRTEHIGAQWTDTYDRRIEFYGDTTNPSAGTAIVYHADGSCSTFSTYTASDEYNGGIWTNQANPGEVLQQAVDSTGSLLGWQYVGSSGTETESYDAQGRLIQIADTSGKTLSLTYNNGITSNSPSDLLLTQVKAQDGRALTLAYDTNSRIQQITDSSGAIYSYIYDSTGRLTSVGYPDGKQRTYYYDEQAFTSNTGLPFALTGIVDETGNRYATYNYGADGRAISTEHAGGVDKFSVQYNTDGSYYSDESVTITTPLGATQQRMFPASLVIKKASSIVQQCSGCTTTTTSTTFDINGNPDLVTDPLGTVTDFNYSSRNLLLQEIDSSNHSSTKRTLQTDWDPIFPLPTERRTLNASGTLVAKTDWTYNSRNQPLTVTQTDPATGATRTTTTNYCEQADVTAGTCPIIGLVKSVDGPRTDVSDVTSYAYYMSDDSSCASVPPIPCSHRAGDLYTITNALGQVTTFTAYDGAGRLLSSIDLNNVETDRSYSPRGWLTQVAVRATNGTTGSGDLITGYTYDNVGQVTRATQADGSYMNYTYDAAHRLTDIADNLGDTIHYTLDNAGNRTREDTMDPSGTLKRSVVRTFNTLDQLATTVNADGITVNASYAYDANGNPTAVTNGRGTVTGFTYDALNRVTLTTQDQGDSTHLNVPTATTYDALDRITQVQDPQGLATSYQYDGFGDLKQLTSPDTGTTTSTYDAAGNVVSKTDARNDVANYAYDALNRLTAITYPADSTLNVSYGYDTLESNCPTGDTYVNGRLTHFNDPSGWSQFCYQRNGFMERRAEYITAGLYTTGDKAFDKMGRPLELTEPRGTWINYTRDGIGRITAMNYQLSGQNTTTPLVSNVSYYPFGPVASITYGTGGSARTLTRTYDQDYVISSVKDTATDGLDLNYSRDAIGNILQIANSAGTSGNQYAYDALNRLTGVNDLNNNPIDAYTYDGTGNRTSKTVGGVTQNYTYYPSTTHQLYNVGAGGPSRTYDASGDTLTTGTGGLSFVYGKSGRMTQLKVNNVQAKLYSYNGFGLRTRKSHDGYPSENTKTLYDDAGHSLGDLDSNSNIIDEIIWMDDLPVGVVNGTSGTVNYIEPDQLGTPRSVIDPTRNLAVWKWPLLNDPFGETAPNQDPDGDGTAYTLNLRFPGQVFDVESGLNYNYFRDYDSSTGRYFESDPIGLAGGTSMYAYVRGNPISAIDKYGLCPKSCGLKKNPKYSVNGVIKGGSSFSWTATFMNDGTHDPKCCEVRQQIQWNFGPPANGFFNPSYQPNTWYDDHGPGGKGGGTYGNRNDQSSIDQYTGDSYYGWDQPQGFDVGTVFKFRLQVHDVCNSGKVIFTGAPIMDAF